MKTSFLIIIGILFVSMTYSQETVTVDSITPVSYHQPIRWGGGIYYRGDYNYINFDGFNDVLAPYNLDIMYKPLATTIGVNTDFNRFTLGLMWGFYFSGKKATDSLNIEFNKSIWGISGGYYLVDSKCWRITSKIDFKWSRYHLINGPMNYKAKLEDYIQNHDDYIDLKFNQLTLNPGFKIEYKFFDKKSCPTDFFYTYGIFGDYNIKLSDSPYVYSGRNRLFTNDRLQMGNFCLGFIVSANLLVP
jgi:hypothetical protein